MQVVTFEDTVILRVIGGPEFLCVIGGHMNLKMYRNSRQDSIDDFDSCTISASSTHEYEHHNQNKNKNQNGRIVPEDFSKIESRPTEGIYYYFTPLQSHCFFASFFALLTRWTKSDSNNNKSQKSIKDAIAAANVAGFV